MSAKQPDNRQPDAYTKKQLDTFKQYIDDSRHVVVVQPERIDPDSMGSALALRQILSDLGKQVTLYASDVIPPYVQHFPGWKDITDQLPAEFDLTIIVDTGSATQFKQTLSDHQDELARRPFVVIDHHPNRETMPFETLELIDNTAGASGQQVVELARFFGWDITADSAYGLAAAIMADTLGLTTPTVTSATAAAVAYCIEHGADMEQLRFNVEAAEALPVKLFPLKLDILQRTQFLAEDRIAITYMTQAEFQRLESDELLMDQVKHELRQLNPVDVAVLVSERGEDYKVSMRANVPVAGPVATRMGGGGHDKAAGFFTKAPSLEDAVANTADELTKELAEYDKRTRQ